MSNLLVLEGDVSSKCAFLIRNKNKYEIKLILWDDRDRYVVSGLLLAYVGKATPNSDGWILFERTNKTNTSH